MPTDSYTRDESFPAVLWRRKWIVVGTLVTFMVVTGLVSATLPKVYSTSSTLLVAGGEAGGRSQNFDIVQVAQVVARSYGDILRSPNIAQLVANRVGGGEDRDSVAQAVRIDPIAETQLIKITAEDTSPTKSKRIADAYATVFIGYAGARLAGRTSTTVSVADAAPLPDDPVRPKPLLYVLIAAVLGLVIGMVLAVLRDRLDNRLRSAEEVEASFTIPVLGRIPRRGRSEQAQTAFTEAFRVVRTNLQFASADEPPRTIAITSADEREGTTTLVTQLTLATASTGASVLVVEANLRRPGVQSFFRRKEPGPLTPGLSNYLVGGGSLEAAVHPTSVPGVDFVPAGPPVPSLSGLLESERGRQALTELASAADVVLFDCPALRFGADAAALAARSDGVILVIDLQTATRGSVREALGRLEAVRARVLGFVLNHDTGVGSEAFGELTAEPARA